MISFLTDYGLYDGFVAACHGVIARIAPDERITDITHLVPARDIRRGAAVLAETVPYLPDGSVHVAVVDPGVGTGRRAVVLVSARGDLLVGPDNGLLPEAAGALGGLVAAYEIKSPAVLAARVSHTFHGRDVFCPAGAHLAAGTPVAEVGPELDPASLVRLHAPVCRRDPATGEVVGEVRTVDHFGNVQTAIGAGPLAESGLVPGPGAAVLLRLTGRAQPLRVPFGRTLGDVPPGELVAFLDSAGLFTVAVNCGDGASRLGVRPGSTVVVSTAR
ncbi:S-adenosyl-l-methionine hydroxide adenosyltransferase family protein [Streptomyces sp. NPDC101118]|uniref:SAM hydrolase/SAM-dependent halogenase family protein n=1 Tax=Streptomyces sp. NPDC101118 TaxID=3366109 RepID=UPI0037F32125